MALLLRHMKRPEGLEETQQKEISVQDHIDGWKKQKEQIASNNEGLSVD